MDRVVMLRPTESGVIFLQQLGRGLRAAEAKTAVTVIDFVGNHAVFLERLRALLSLGGPAPPTVRDVLASTAPIDLPAGCSVELTLEAKELLSRLFRVGGADEVERTYRELRLERGARAKAGELERMGYPPARLRPRHGSWVDFVRSERDLTPEEEKAVTAGGGFLREVEVTEMTKCFKMVTLEALLEADALMTGLPLHDLALRSHALLRRSPELFADVRDDERVMDLDAAGEKRWLAYWRKNPIELDRGEEKRAAPGSGSAAIASSRRSPSTRTSPAPSCASPGSSPTIASRSTARARGTRAEASRASCAASCRTSATRS